MVWMMELLLLQHVPKHGYTTGVMRWGEKAGGATVLFLVFAPLPFIPLSECDPLCSGLRGLTRR